MVPSKKQVSSPKNTFISVTAVLIGYLNRELVIGLVKSPDHPGYALAGQNWTSEKHLQKELMDLLSDLNVSVRFVEQLGAFDVDSPGVLDVDHALVRIAYLVIVDAATLQDIQKSSTFISWFNAGDLPDIFQAEEALCEHALTHLAVNLDHKPIAFHLMPERFTIPELMGLYEQVLKFKLNRGNFYRSLKKREVLEYLNIKVDGVAHKAPDLYRFKKKVFALSL